MQHSYSGRLQVQELPFAIHTIGITAEGTVSGDDAVAGDNESYGIAGQGLADCLGGTAIKKPGEVAVGTGPAVRNGEKSLPDAALESCAAGIETRENMRLTAGKIIIQPSESLGEDGNVLHSSALAD